jgi:hypothetical protein
MAISPHALIMRHAAHSASCATIHCHAAPLRLATMAIHRRAPLRAPLSREGCLFKIFNPFETHVASVFIKMLHMFHIDVACICLNRCML